MKKEKTAAITIPHARETITRTIMSYCKNHDKVERQDLFKPCIDSLNLSMEQLKDTRPDSTLTRYKALTGTIINELVQKGSIILGDKTDSKKQPEVAADNVDIFKQKKDSVRDYLYSKYLTDDEKKDKMPNSKANIIRSILGYKKNKELIEIEDIEIVQNKIEEQFVKIAKISGKVDHYPTTPIGNCLRNHREKYQKRVANQLSAKDYEKSLVASINEAIYLSGGVNFSRISLELVKSAYPTQEVYDDKVTDGGNDHGIDAEFYVKDKLGFIDKIAIQAKIKQKTEASIGEKITREFLGSMLAAKATKGVIVSNATIHRESREIAKKVPNLMFVDKHSLISLMQEFKVGILLDNNKIPYLDDKLFLIE